MKNKTLGIFIFLFASIGLITGAYADSESIKTRMMARLPVIKALKVKGIIGENNRGYLEFLGQNKEREDAVNAENADRKTVYEAIAKQQNTALETIEKYRAAQIEQKAESGEWLQDANGKWYKKQ